MAQVAGLFWPFPPLEGAWPPSPSSMAGSLGRGLADLAAPGASASACRNMRGKFRVILYLVAQVTALEVQSFPSALVGAILLSLVSLALNWLFRD